MAHVMLRVLNGEFTVHRLCADAPVPQSVGDARPTWIARTDDELSIVCPSSVAVGGSTAEPGWSCLQVRGPLDFEQVGILSRLSAPLAAAGIPLLALSTFDTDYLMVRTRDLREAVAVLVRAGHRVGGPPATDAPR